MFLKRTENRRDFPMAASLASVLDAAVISCVEVPVREDISSIVEHMWSIVKIEVEQLLRFTTFPC